MKRLLTTISVLLLLATTWGQVLAASLCVHMQAAHSCCFIRKAEHKHYQHTHHEGMAMTVMEGAESVGMYAHATEDAEEGVSSIGQPMRGCTPCVQNSTLQTTTVAIGFVHQSKRDVKMAAPLEAALLAPIGLTSTLSVSSRPHAPPNASAPRHVLVNVFRI